MVVGVVVGCWPPIWTALSVSYIIFVCVFFKLYLYFRLILGETPIVARVIARSVASQMQLDRLFGAI